MACCGHQPGWRFLLFKPGLERTQRVSLVQVGKHSSSRGTGADGGPGPAGLPVPCHPCSFPGRSHPAPSLLPWPAPFPSGMATCSDLLPAGLQFALILHHPTLFHSFHSSPSWTPARPSERPDGEGGGWATQTACWGMESQPSSLLFSAAHGPAGPRGLCRLGLTYVQRPGQACPSLAPGRSAASPMFLRGSGPAAHGAHPFPRDPAPGHPASWP